MRKLLITGALGHIGSKFIHDLKENEYQEVRMIDNLATQRYSSLFNLSPKIKFIFFHEDILEADLKEYIKGVDTVVHLAAITDAETSFEKEDEIEKVNFSGTEKIMETCISEGCKLIFPSTTSVYGSQKELVDETCDKEDLLPQSPYASFKLKSEEMIKDMAENNKLDACILRFGTIFGTSIGMRFHTAVNKFCWQAVLGEPLSVWKTALNQKRPYLGINDAVNAIRFFIQRPMSRGDIFNVVTSNYTVQEVIDSIRKLVNEVKINLVDAEIMNQLSYEASTKKLQSIGFDFKDNLDNGIEETIKLLKDSNNLSF